MRDALDRMGSFAELFAVNEDAVAVTPLISRWKRLRQFLWLV